MFNVLTDNWILAMNKNGDIKEYGILELLREAPGLERIIGDTPLIEFGIYRFLFTFLSDIYRPKSSFDIKALISKGKFSNQAITDYVNTCESEGVSFDLFDRKNPFMQEVVEEENRSVKNVAVLNPIIPTATSRTFFNHGFDRNRSLTIAEAARALTSTTIFPRGGAGYKACIAGEGLVFNIICGDNLFETLALGMVPMRVYGAGEEEYGHPYYRAGGFEQGKKCVDIPLLYGLSFPIRSVHFFKEGDEISEIHFSSGMSPSVEHWKDPYVAYTNDKDGKPHPMRARQDNSTGSLVGLWRNIVTIADKDNGIRILENAKSRKNVRVVSYSIYVNNAIQDVQRAEFLLPMDIYADEKKAESLRNAIEIGEKIGGELRKQLHNTVNDLKSTVADSVIRDYIYRYYGVCEALFSEQVVEKPDLNKWVTEVGNCALDLFNDFLDKFCVSADLIQEAVTRRNALCGQMKKLGWRAAAQTK